MVLKYLNKPALRSGKQNIWFTTLLNISRSEKMVKVLIYVKVSCINVGRMSMSLQTLVFNQPQSLG